MTPLNAIGVEPGKIEELIGRVERATGPDREIDGRIAVAFRIHPFGPFHWFDNSPEIVLKSHGGDVWMADDKGRCPGSSFQAANYTASIDSALALVDRVLPGRWCEILDAATAQMWATEADVTFAGSRIRLDRLPLAIILALLRALSRESNARDAQPDRSEG